VGINGETRAIETQLVNKRGYGRVLWGLW